MKQIFKAVCAAALLVGAFLLWQKFAPVQPAGVVTVSDTVWCVDTVRVIEPRAVVVERVRVVTDTLTIAGDTVRVAVNVPIAQSFYTDSANGCNWSAWVSGYRAKIDSLQIVNNRAEITNTVTTTQPAPRFGLGLIGGFGVGKNGLSPYVGAGVYYRLERK